MARPVGAWTVFGGFRGGCRIRAGVCEAAESLTIPRRPEETTKGAGAIQQDSQTTRVLVLVLVLIETTCTFILGCVSGRLLLVFFILPNTRLHEHTRETQSSTVTRNKNPCPFSGGSFIPDEGGERREHGPERSQRRAT